MANLFYFPIYFSSSPCNFHISHDSPEKQNKQVCVCINRWKDLFICAFIYFMELTLEMMGANKVELCGAGPQAEGPGKG